MLSFMAVMAREQWTDQRMDDLNGRMEKGFDRVDADIRELRSEIGSHRGETKTDFERVNDEFGRLRAEMKAGFERVDDEFVNVRAEMKAGFAEVSGRIDGRIDGVHGRIDSMQRTMIIGFVTLFTGIVASIITAILAG